MASSNIVQFRTGTKAQYEGLSTKDPNTLYFLSDTGEIYKGSTPYSEKLPDGNAVLKGRMTSETQDDFLTSGYKKGWFAIAMEDCTKTAGTGAGVTFSLKKYDILLCTADTLTSSTEPWVKLAHGGGGSDPDAVTADDTLEDGCVVLGDGEKTVRTLPNGDETEVLTIGKTGVEWRPLPDQKLYWQTIS